MAMNFPSAPAEGAIYQAPGGPTYKFIGGLWVPQQGSGVFLEKANNLSDLVNAETARQNLGLRWRTLARVSLDAPLAFYPLAIPDDIKLIRGDFGVFPTSGDVNFVMRFSNNGGSSFLTGAADYIQTYTWQNANAAPAFAFTASGSFITLSGPTQLNVPTMGYLTAHLGKPGSLAKVEYAFGNTNSAGADQNLTGTGRPIITGRMNGVVFIFSLGNIGAGSYFTIEGAS